MDFIKIKMFDVPQSGRKYSQFTYLPRILYPEYIKNTLNSKKTDSPIRKTGKALTRYFTKECMYGK